VVFDKAQRAEIAALVEDTLARGSLTLGPLTKQFEAAFAERHSSSHAVAVASGTAALEIALRCLGVSGRDVVVPANTFYATAGAVVHAGARPVFADISVDTMALTPSTIEAALTPSTAAVVLVHIGGFITPEVEAIRRLCDDRGLALVEDAAHAHGSSSNGRSAGSFGQVGAFSFYPTKVVAAGEGGMILTEDPGLREEALIYRDQGKGSFATNDHVRLGYAWRMSELSAAVGLVHLKALDRSIAVRRSVAARYDAALREVPGVDPVLEPAGCVSNYYKYIALLDPTVDRDQFKKRLSTEAEVSLSGEVYATPLHLQPVFSEFSDGALPGSEEFCSRHVCLPVHSDMSDAEVDHVLESFERIYRSM
jgi:dTDP-4-amino-4,6-dideoxygalactose transaminase